MRVYLTPVAKPRQTRADRWQQRPAVMKYRDFADALRLLYPQPLPAQLKLTFLIPMPRSWSAKKRYIMSFEPHQQAPDIDNLVKAVLDALCVKDSDIYKPNDSYIWDVRAKKIWAGDSDTVGGIEIEELVW